ncbi:MAG: alpha/beta hydrolase [Planctomycetales bacterium]|nr:alpha/beta hydrolase [Planctomycetales bacterium]
MPRIQLRDVDTHYQQTGAGPDVILIHAFTSNLSVWMMTGITEALSDYRVTMYDLRGHGASSVPSTHYTSADMSDDLFQLMDALGIDSAYLVGHSYGGVIGMHAASLAPQRVGGVILSDTYFPGLRELEPDMGQADVWQELRDTLRKANVEVGDQVDFARLFRVVRDFDAEQLAVVKRELGPAGARWLSQVGQMADSTAGTEMFEEAGLTADRIAAVTTPVVALYDEFSPFDATSGFLRDRLADCVTDMVPKAKHLAPVQNPADLVRLIKTHLDRWSGR